jgi:hypothetical protein
MWKNEKCYSSQRMMPIAFQLGNNNFSAPFCPHSAFVCSPYFSYQTQTITWCIYESKNSHLCVYLTTKSFTG